MVFLYLYIIKGQQVFALQNLDLSTFDHMLFCLRLLYIMFGTIYLILNAPKTIQLADALFSSYCECLSSRKIIQ